MKEITITLKEANQRVDKYLLKYFNHATKGFIYKMFRKKNIKLNNKKISGNEIIREYDIIRIYMSEDTINKFSRININEDIPITFDVIYEDDNILICNKPVGLLSQPNGKINSSLVEQIIAYLIKRGDYKPELMKGYRPGICNRLDRNTSGIIIAGKNIMALQDLSKLIATHSIDKHYQCITAKKISKGCTIEGYIIKNSKTNKVKISNDSNGQYIKTIYKPIIYNNNYSLLDVQIITGKTHQIRIHLASIGHPIIGDFKYGNKKDNDMMKKKYQLKHQLLHAYSIRFHVSSGLFKYLDDKTFFAPFPNEFQRIKENLLQ